MRKLLFVGALTLGAVSCAPDIKQDPAPDVVVAQFDPAASPAVVPTPNDLAINQATGLVSAPIDPKAPAAEQEFTKDYLNTLNGFPTTAAASTKIVGLDASTVNPPAKPPSVMFIDLLAGTPIATPPVTPTIAYDGTAGQLTIAPPATGWPKGGKYLVALIGGENGLKGQGGKKVVGSSVWSLATLQSPLVTCQDLSAPDCAATTDLIPVESHDPAEQIKERNAAALQLEQLRRAYSPLLDALVAKGVKREDIVLLWTFTIMNQPEVTFDPSKSIVPFPNNLLLDPTGKHLNLPIPPNASDSQKALLGGLNTLDGFSTTAPIVSENSETLGPIEQGSKLDQNGFAQAARFFKIDPATGGTAPNVKACLVPGSADAACPQVAATSTQQIQFVPQRPLDEKSTYAAVLTTDLKDEKGRFVAPSAAFALLRLSNPLAVGGKSQVSVVPDAIAAQLEPARAAFKPVFDALAKGGIPRSKIALGWAFRTQSTVAVQKQLYALPSTAYAATLPSQPMHLLDITPKVISDLTAAGLPHDKIGKVYQGLVVLPVLLTGTSGTLDPEHPKPQFASFLLVQPNTTAPATGYPVTIFSHGLKSARTTVFPLVNSLAAGGHATIAIDTVFHGERSTCAGITAASGIEGGITTPDAACNTGGSCDVIATSPTYGRCIATDPATRKACNPTSPLPTDGGGDLYCASQGQGRCLSTDTTDATKGICEGSTFKLNAYGVPAISGWNLLNLTNLFATRDNFRQHTVDHAQLERVLTSTATGNLNDQLAAQGAAKLDGAKIDYVGQSLGGILGPLYTAASPKVGRAVYNVPAGNLAGILLTSKAFADAATAFKLALKAQGIEEGTPAFDQFIVLAMTILDPADPINYIYSVENGAGIPAGRKAFIQYIEGDLVAPNNLTEALFTASTKSSGEEVLHYKFETTLAEDDRHAFLLNFKDGGTVTGKAQSQVVEFLNTGNVTP
ncbi:hypothetical protein [Hyalangium versicolor]|uniref:hypothetical protein n=1 Tax=Hyalangium versicolor TaxID=2861190 RepID=UPI001CCF7C85|nr:hypothetical protein [Hyalangium versicolor]